MPSLSVRRSATRRALRSAAPVWCASVVSSSKSRGVKGASLIFGAAGEDADQRVLEDNRRVGAHLRLAEKAAFALWDALVSGVELRGRTARCRCRPAGKLPVDQPVFGNRARFVIAGEQLQLSIARCVAVVDQDQRRAAHAHQAVDRARRAVDQRGEFERAGNLLTVAPRDFGRAGQRAVQDQIDQRFGKLAQRRIDDGCQERQRREDERAVRFQQIGRRESRRKITSAVTSSEQESAAPSSNWPRMSITRYDTCA